MLDLNAFSSSVTSSKLNNCLTGLIESLKNLFGFSVDDINKILADLTSIFSAQLPISDIESLLKDIAAELKLDINELLADNLNANQILASLPLHKAHEVYNSETSLDLPDPVIAKGNSSAPEPIKTDNADYTTSKNYPMAAGSIDSSKNWYKVDQKSHLTERAHSSRSHFKIDEEGNVTLYVSGSLKLLVDGSVTTQINGSLDSTIKGSEFHRVKGQKIESITGRVMEKYGGMHVTNVSGPRYENASVIHHNSGGPSVPS